MKTFQKATVWTLIVLTLLSCLSCGLLSGIQAKAASDALALEEAFVQEAAPEEPILSADAAPAEQIEDAAAVQAASLDAAEETMQNDATENDNVSNSASSETTEEESPSDTTDAPETPELPAPAPSVKIQTDTNEVTVLNQLTLSAVVSGTDSSAKFTWKSSSPLVASVTSKGVVTGLSVGKTTITVTAKVDGQTLEDSMDIYVIQPENTIHNTLSDRQILGYQYSYKDDYYYTNDRQCWQKNFGFSKFYDLVAPYVLLEYDYVRVYFTYEGKDWMIQLWKGQYGMLFYGSEFGVYTKRHTSRDPGVFTLFSCAKESDWLNMEMSLYHDTTGFGTYKREFTREYGKYWWCTGFKRGHLRVEEPARELRTTGTITLKDAEMTRLFTEGLQTCGFSRAADANSIELDQFYVDGNNVMFTWQNISAAETTMPIKALAAANVLAAMLGPFALALMFFLDIGLLLLA